MVFIKFPYNNKIAKEYLFCKELTGKTIGKDIFNLISTLFEENNILRKTEVSICIHCAFAMTGNKKGFIHFDLEKNSSIIIAHCFLHRENLAFKCLKGCLKNTLEKTIKITSFKV